MAHTKVATEQDITNAKEAFFAARTKWELTNPLYLIRSRITEKDERGNAQPLTIAGMARMLGTSPATEKRWEIGVPSIEKMEQIAKVFNIPFDELNASYQDWYAKRPDFQDFLEGKAIAIS